MMEQYEKIPPTIKERQIEYFRLRIFPFYETIASEIEERDNIIRKEKKSKKGGSDVPRGLR